MEAAHARLSLSMAKYHIVGSKKDSKGQEPKQSSTTLSQNTEWESNNITINITKRAKRSAISLQVTTRQQ